MNLDDFRCMRQGQVLAALNAQEAKLLKPYYHKQGEAKKRALLMIHGFSSSPAVYRAFIPEIKGYDAIVAPVLPGHGENLAAFAKITAQDWLSYIEKVASELTREFEHVDVMGLSLGGLLACHISQHFKLNHLYLLAPALDIQLALPGTIRLALSLKSLGFQAIRNFAGNIHTPHLCEIAYRQLPITTIIEILTLVKEFKWVQPTCPTDLFLGHYDEVVASKKVAARFANSENTQIHWLSKSAHVLPLDGDRKHIIAHVNKQKNN